MKNGTKFRVACAPRARTYAHTHVSRIQRNLIVAAQFIKPMFLSLASFFLTTFYDDDSHGDDDDDDGDDDYDYDGDGDKNNENNSHRSGIRHDGSSALFHRRAGFDSDRQPMRKVFALLSRIALMRVTVRLELPRTLHDVIVPRVRS